MEHVRAHWKNGAARLSDVITHRQLRDKPIYREFLHPLGIEKQLGLLVEDVQYGVTAVSLQRNGRDFSERDMDVLTFLQPHINQAYKNAVDFSAAKILSSGMEHVVNLCDMAVVWLSHDEKVEWMSSRAELWLADYFQKEQRGKPVRSLPVRLAEWVRHQKTARETGIDKGWRGEVMFAGSRGQLNVRWICEEPARSYLILSEQRTKSGYEGLISLGITVREAEILHWLAEGKSNEAIAIILGLSRRTVEKHVERILVKLGVETRVEAALRAAEHRRLQ